MLWYYRKQQEKSPISLYENILYITKSIFVVFKGIWFKKVEAHRRQGRNLSNNTSFIHIFHVQCCMYHLKRFALCSRLNCPDQISLILHGHWLSLPCSDCSSWPELRWKWKLSPYHFSCVLLSVLSSWPTHECEEESSNKRSENQFSPLICCRSGLSWRWNSSPLTSS